MPPFKNRSSAVGVHIDEDMEEKSSVRQEPSLNKTIDVESKAGEAEMSALERSVAEPKTGIEFPLILSCKHQSSTSNSQVLAGVGFKGLSIVKIKTIKIYAFGFYIEPNGLRAQLGGNFTSLSFEELKDNPQFYEDLLRHDLEMTVRLVIHYKALKAGMVRSAFDTSLRNRLRKIKGEEDDDGLDIFNTYFSESLPLARGTVIDFRRLSGGQLRTEVNGKLIGIIHSSNFCRALLDIYIGDPPVSLSAKQEVAERVFQLLK